MALGEVGLGWLLAFHSRSMVSFFSLGEKCKGDFSARMLTIFGRMFTILGWILLVAGSLGLIAMFLIPVAIALRSLWS